MDKRKFLILAFLGGSAFYYVALLRQVQLISTSLTITSLLVLMAQVAAYDRITYYWDEEMNHIRKEVKDIDG